MVSHQTINPRLIEHHQPQESSRLLAITHLIAISPIAIVEIASHSRPHLTGFG